MQYIYDASVYRSCNQCSQYAMHILMQKLKGCQLVVQQYIIYINLASHLHTSDVCPECSSLACCTFWVLLCHFPFAHGQALIHVYSETCIRHSPRSDQLSVSQRWPAYRASSKTGYEYAWYMMKQYVEVVINVAIQ